MIIAGRDGDKRFKHKDWGPGSAATGSPESSTCCARPGLSNHQPLPGPFLWPEILWSSLLGAENLAPRNGGDGLSESKRLRAEGRPGAPSLRLRSFPLVLIGGGISGLRRGAVCSRASPRPFSEPTTTPHPPHPLQVEVRKVQASVENQMLTITSNRQKHRGQVASLSVRDLQQPEGTSWSLGGPVGGQAVRLRPPRPAPGGDNRAGLRRPAKQPPTPRNESRKCEMR